ncbi:MAG: DUF2169 domain-containing protein [Polyangiaceae bacterium]
MTTRRLPALPALHAPAQCAADLVLWRLAGYRLSVVAKLTLRVEPRVGPAELAPPESLSDRESAGVPSDRIPLLPGAEVLFTGAIAQTPGAGFRISRGPSVLLEKGIGRGAANFGPLPASSPERLARLGGRSLRIFDHEPFELESPFDFSFFHAAPTDQRLASLRGDEVITLFGASAHGGRIQPPNDSLELRLPNMAVAARVLDARDHLSRTVELLPDRLLVDTDRWLATLTYRAGLSMEDTERCRIVLGLGAAESELTFANPDDPATLTGRYRPVAFRTAALDPNALRAASLPFADALLGRPARRAPQTVSSGLPFAAGAANTDDEPPKEVRPAHEARHETVALDPASLRDQAAAFLREAARRAELKPSRAAQNTEPARVLPTPPVDEPTEITSPRSSSHATEQLDPALVQAAALPFAGGPASAPASAPAHRAGRVLLGLPFADVRAPAQEESEGEPLDDAPRPRSRASELVPIVTDGPLSVASYTWQISPPEDVLVIAVKASFDLVPGGAATLREEPELLSGDVYVDDEPEKALAVASDFAILKPQVDILIRGHAYAPLSSDATATRAGVVVEGESERLERHIAVFGDRTWGALSPSEPAPFEALPLRYDRSFGGPQFASNRAGLGHKTERLPNFEELTDLVQQKGDTPSPACLGPVHPLSSGRWGLIGTYNRVWMQSRWPYFAEDFDYRFFQAAAPNQRMRAVKGDEAFELLGVHPEHSVLRGRLAGGAARAFVELRAQQNRQAGAGFREVPLRVDTITFAPDDNAVHVVWRGLVKVSDDDAPEVEHIFAMFEPPASPRVTLEQARARYLAQLEPPEENKPAAVEIPTPEDHDEDDAATEEAIRAAMERIRSHEAAVTALAPPLEGPLEPLPTLTPVELAEWMRTHGASDDEVEKMMTLVSREPVTEPPEAGTPDLRALVLERLSRGESLAGLELRGADLSDLQLANQDLKGSDLTGANLDRVDLTGADLSDAKLASASLVAANLRDADLSNADLTGARATTAQFKAAKLTRVEARGLRARAADFTGAKLAGAKLAGARLPDTKFDDADLSDVDLTESDLRGATFVRASSPRARLYDVRADKSQWDRADLTGARAEGAVFTGASFFGVRAREAIFERATVAKAIFTGALLEASSFHRADGRNANFDGCDLREARMLRGDFRHATFLKANLMGAKCDRALLERCDLRRSNLYAASLNRALLTNTTFDGAIVHRTQLEMGGSR